MKLVSESTDSFIRLSVYLLGLNDSLVSFIFLFFKNFSNPIYVNQTM